MSSSDASHMNEETARPCNQGQAGITRAPVTGGRIQKGQTGAQDFEIVNLGILKRSTRSLSRSQKGSTREGDE